MLTYEDLELHLCVEYMYANVTKEELDKLTTSVHVTLREGIYYVGSSSPINELKDKQLFALTQ